MPLYYLYYAYKQFTFIFQFSIVIQPDVIFKIRIFIFNSCYIGIKHGPLENAKGLKDYYSIEASKQYHSYYGYTGLWKC